VLSQVEGDLEAVGRPLPGEQAQALAGHEGGHTAAEERRGDECSLKKIAPPELHDGTDVVLTGSGGVGVFRAPGRNAQHQIATLAR